MEIDAIPYLLSRAAGLGNRCVETIRWIVFFGLQPCQLHRSRAEKAPRALGVAEASIQGDAPTRPSRVSCGIGDKWRAGLTAALGSETRPQTKTHPVHSSCCTLRAVESRAGETPAVRGNCNPARAILRVDNT